MKRESIVGLADLSDDSWDLGKSDDVRSTLDLGDEMSEIISQKPLTFDSSSRREARKKRDPRHPAWEVVSTKEWPALLGEREGVLPDPITGLPSTNSHNDAPSTPYATAYYQELDDRSCLFLVLFFLDVQDQGVKCICVSTVI